MQFPNLDNVKRISIDLETCDEELDTKGPGTRRGAFTAGYGIGTDDAQWYFPVAHGSGQNYDRDAVKNWLRPILRRRDLEVVGAHLLYDLEFLYFDGLDVNGTIHDIQIAEPLLDENQFSYSLDAVSKRRGGAGKDEDRMMTLIQAKFGRHAGKECIWKLAGDQIQNYTSADLRLPLEIWDQQRKVLEEEDLLGVYELERRQLPLLLAMRIHGVNVDLERAQRIDEELTTKIENLKKDLRGVSPTKVKDIEKVFIEMGWPYGKTPTGMPSFTKDYIAGLCKQYDDPFLVALRDVRKLQKSRDTFVRGYILGKNINGKIYCKFNQLKSDDTGTVSGRYSSSLPNLQNIPSRDKYWGPLIRSMFVPKKGNTWYKFDMSQIEYRLFVHYATGRKAEMAKQMYRDNPKTDFHEWAANMTRLERRDAKDFNFAQIYGQGLASTAAQINRSLEEAKVIYDIYHTEIDFAKPLYNRAQDAAQRRGYVKTISGRRARFPFWESGDWDVECKPIRDRNLAVRTWGRVQRAWAYKALNRIIQGGAADIFKDACARFWESGLWKKVGVPTLMVHDELDMDNDQDPAVMLEVKELLEQCSYELDVPIVWDLESGPNWGDVK